MFSVLGIFKNARGIKCYDAVSQCGKSFTPSIANVKNCNTRSCGCICKGRKTHGLSGTPEAKAVKRIKDTCTNPRNKAYHNYGGRGIECHIRDAGHLVSLIGMRPSKEHEVDRYPDNDGHYEKGNLRWATAEEQSRNRRTNVNITLMGVTRCSLDWSNLLCIDRGSFRRHSKKHGCTPEQAVQYYINKKCASFNEAMSNLT